MSKEKLLFINVPKDDVVHTLQDAQMNGVERGVFLRSPIGKEVFKEFNKLKSRGYFPVGMIVEDGFNIEFLFQRHPKQTDEMKFAELKDNEGLKL